MSETISYDEQHNPGRRQTDRHPPWFRLHDVYAAIGIMGGLLAAVGAYYGAIHQSDKADALHEQRITTLESGVADLRSHGSDEAKIMRGSIEALLAKLDAHKGALDRVEHRTQELYRILLEERRERR